MMVQNAFQHTAGHIVTCGDADIYVEEMGNSELPVLLMLHGGFGNIEDFNTITSSLRRQFRLIGVDSRGHGKSDLGNRRLTYERLADDLAQVIDSLQLTEFSILGFSDGGIVAYRYAARHDPRLGKIVTVGSCWEMSEDDPVWEKISGMTGDIWKEMFPQSYESYIRLNPEPDFDRFADAVIGMWTDLGPDGHPGALMTQVDHEILCVRGDNDPLTTLDSMAKLRLITENVNLLNIPFSGHVAFVDAPDIFLRNIERFFDISLGEPFK